MSFEHCDFQRKSERLSAEDAQERLGVLALESDLGEVMIADGGAAIDGVMVAAIGLNYTIVGSEGFLRVRERTRSSFAGALYGVSQTIRWGF